MTNITFGKACRNLLYRVTSIPLDSNDETLIDTKQAAQLLAASVPGNHPDWITEALALDAKAKRQVVPCVRIDKEVRYVLVEVMKAANPHTIDRLWEINSARFL